MCDLYIFSLVLWAVFISCYCLLTPSFELCWSPICLPSLCCLYFWPYLPKPRSWRMMSRLTPESPTSHYSHLNADFLGTLAVSLAMTLLHLKSTLFWWAFFPKPLLFLPLSFFLHSLYSDFIFSLKQVLWKQLLWEHPLEKGSQLAWF